MRMYALRGAISVAHNDAKDILEATTELMSAIMERNALRPEDVVSCIFTATNDLNAEFPAVAARALGFESVPLLCTAARREAALFVERHCVSSPWPLLDHAAFSS